MSDEERHERAPSRKKPDKPEKPTIAKEADAAARADHEKQFLAETQERFCSLRVEAEGAAALAKTLSLPNRIPSDTLASLEALREQALHANPPADDGEGKGG